MNGAPTGFTPYEMRTSVIKVLGYEGKGLRGVLINPYYDEEMPFDNLTQLLLLLDALIDGLQYPQRTVELRRFERGFAEAAVGSGGGHSEGKALATFALKLLFCQNASWQGSLTWLDKKLESPFRSVLELIVLMDSVLVTCVE